MYAALQNSYKMKVKTIRNYKGEEQPSNHSHDVQAFTLSY
jgi:hypothetical protein